MNDFEKRRARRDLEYERSKSRLERKRELLISTLPKVDDSERTRDELAHLRSVGRKVINEQVQREFPDPDETDTEAT